MSQIPSHTSIATTGRRPRPVTSGENVIPAENLILEVDDLKSMCADMLSEEDGSQVSVRSYYDDAIKRTAGLVAAHKTMSALSELDDELLPLTEEGYGSAVGRVDRLKTDLDWFARVLSRAASIDPGWDSAERASRLPHTGHSEYHPLIIRLCEEKWAMVNSLHVRATVKTLLTLSAWLDHARIRSETRLSLSGQPEYQQECPASISLAFEARPEEPPDITGWRTRLLDICAHMSFAYEESQHGDSVTTMEDLEPLARVGSPLAWELGRRRKARAVLRQEGQESAESPQQGEALVGWI